jgi:predicted DNA-binding protein (MmcQ/YjbR family)
MLDSNTVADYCRSLSGATEGYPFSPDALVFKVGGRIFAILVEGSVSLKCDPLLAQALREEFSAVTPGYHLNKRHWNTVQLDGSVPDEVLMEWIQDSYALAIAGLTRAQRASLQM